MQILVIDNNIMQDSWGASELCSMARLAAGATIHVRRAPHDDLPRDPGPFDRVLVSGSKTSVEDEAPWIDHLDEFVRRALDQNKPLLGVCYGHQTLARVLGGKQCLRKAERGEFGWGRIEQTQQDSPLLRGLPKAFHSFQWHSEEVGSLPPGTRLLARSELCAIQAFEVLRKPAYGVQFHPERALDAGEAALTRRNRDNPKLELLNRGKGAHLFDSSVGETIFANFLASESTT